MTYNKNDEINDLRMERPHLVILGAGASRAFELENGEKNGKRLPLMDKDFVEIVGIGDILTKNNIVWEGKNFEVLYDEISSDPKLVDCINLIEQQIHNYFSSLVLPEKPTLYDHLVLSLKKKDIVVTFNWDPLLFQALKRNSKRAEVPFAMYLHGNVAIGYCADGNSTGPVGMRCSFSGKPYHPIPLLYPIQKKNYSESQFLEKSWRQARVVLNNAFVITIFGYGAPDSDIDAKNIFQESWGDKNHWAIEQVEIIDIQTEEVLLGTWDCLIHSHHYNIYTNFYDSLLARHPRRSIEAFWQEKMECEILDDHPVPKGASFREIDEWIQPCTQIEKLNKE